MAVRLNSSYLSDGLAATNEAQDVELLISGPLTPLVITNSKRNPRYLVMPVRLHAPPEPKAAGESEEVTPNLDELLRELDALIGLQPVKTQVRDLIAFLRLQTLRRERGLPSDERTRHLVFAGNPGTGKNTVARLIGRMYRSLGLLSHGHLVEADGSALVTEYLGQTAIKTNTVIDQGRDGVLFIDEAYTLARSALHGDSYGHEAIDTLLKRMEDERGRLVVIVAGYPRLMNEFLGSNPGLRSGSRTIQFPDYSDEELLAILQKLCADHTYELAPDDENYARQILADVVRDESFGNARYVRNIFEAALNAQAVR